MSQVKPGLTIVKPTSGSHSDGRSGGADVRGQKGSGKTRANTRDFPRWVYHAHNVAPPVLDQETALQIRQGLPAGSVRTGYNDNVVAWRQATGVRKLRPQDWPSICGKPAWPSSPSFNEWLEMCRRGAKSSGDIAPTIPSGRTCRVRLGQFNDFRELVVRVASTQIVGVRADVEVPQKFWGSFRYRWGFLILTAPCLSIGLARFLVGRWCTDPCSLWLARRVTLKQYLRAVPAPLMERALASKERVHCVSGPSSDGTIRSSDFSESDSESEPGSCQSSDPGY